MPKIVVSEEEWKIAHERMDSKSDGSKLPYSAITTQEKGLQPRPNSRHLFSFYKTTHSFIKIKGTLYAIAQGKSDEAIVGCGTYSVVKYMVDEKAVLCVVKIQKKLDSDPSRRHEISILESLNLSKGTNLRRDSNKFYTHLHYKGRHNILSIIPTLNTDEARFQVAIALCHTVDRLHRGLDAKENIPYVHLDIKPANFIRDEDGQIHLIDFGFAERGLNEIPDHLDKGTPAYLPNRAHFKTHSRHKFDILALKRTLFMPESIYCIYGKEVVATSGFFDLIGVLTEKMLLDYGLDPYINTAHDKDYFNESEQMDASILAALLINASFKLGIDPERVITNRLLSRFIIEHEEEYPVLKLFVAHKAPLTDDDMVQFCQDKQLRAALRYIHELNCSQVKLSLVFLCFQHLGYDEKNKIIYHWLQKNTDVGVIVQRLQTLNSLHYLPSLFEEHHLSEAFFSVLAEQLRDCSEEMFESNQSFLKPINKPLDEAALRVLWQLNNACFIELINRASTDDEVRHYLKLAELMVQLKIKQEAFKHNEPHAARAIEELTCIFNASIETLIANAKSEALDFRALKKEYTQAIKAQRAVLESHRGILGILDMVLALVASLAVFFPITYGIRESLGKNYYFFKTKSCQILDEIDLNLELMSSGDSHRY